MALNWNDYKELHGLDKEVLSRYKLLEKLGKGSFGTVFKVHDERLDRVCALKILNIDNFDEPEDEADAKRRFIKEAKTLANCNHSNIVTIYNIGGEDTIPYFDMQYIHGMSLQKILKQKMQLGLVEILNISNGILSALGCMHDNGNAHRDLKPANIMIESSTEKSVLIDFGIVKDLKKNTSYTQSGKAIGTPLYMSPEQIESGTKLDYRTDIYSFGVILFEMITGKSPYSGSLAQILFSHLQDPIPDVRGDNIKVPPAIQTVVNKSMAKKPEDRYQGAKEFLNALKKVSDDRTVEVIRIKEENHAKDMGNVPVAPKKINKVNENVSGNEDRGEEDVELTAKLPWGKRIRIIGYVALSVIIILIIWGVGSLLVDNAKKNALAFQEYVSSAKADIQKNDLNKATKSLNKAKEINDSQEVQQLFETIANKKRAIMSKDFKSLEGLLKEDFSLENKKAKCDEFLNRHKDIPPNRDTRLMVSQVEESVTQLKRDIKTGKEYQGCISSAKALLLTGDYSKALDELGKAKKIKADEKEITTLTAEIKKEQVKAMINDYNILKASLSDSIGKDVKLKNYRDFHTKYKDIPRNEETQNIIDEADATITFLQSEIKKEAAYKKHIEAAKAFIAQGDLRKAADEREKAGKIIDGPEILELSQLITAKQVELMKADSETLKEKMQGDVNSRTEKIQLCREFLAKYKDAPRNKETNPMITAANAYITKYDAEIKAEQQYQQYMTSGNKYLESKEYQKAETAFKRARRLKDTLEARNGLTAARAKLKEIRDNEKVNGDTLYNKIKDNMNRSKYLDFKKKYHQSAYLPDLKTRVLTKDKNLPPEKYWDKPIKKNSKGYYEYTFIIMQNSHVMIYIPGEKSWIDKYEVSWEQYRKYLRLSGKPVPPITEKKMKREEDEFPVTITYTEAVQYCKRHGFRLPTEKEWEYLAGKDRLIYPWGNDLADANGIYRANFAGSGDGFQGTAPVKRFEGESFLSPFGASNMAGNVWEWVRGSTLKGGGYYSTKTALKIVNKKAGSNNDTWGIRCVKEER